MADPDAAKLSLFGAAPRRAANKPNPYANIPEQPGAPPAPAKAAAPAAPASSSSRPPRDELAPLDADERRRMELMAGGKKREPAAAAAPAPPIAALDAEALLAPPPEDDGALEFDFEGLNITAGMAGGGRAGGGGGGGSVPNDELNFDAIDADLTNFAQDAVIREALSRGVDLRLYARQVDHELRAMEMLSIGDYVKEADSIAGLFEQVTSCESVLGQMQGLLQSFAENLGGISTEIRTLQEQSLAMSVKMANRKALNVKIQAFMAKVAVPEVLIDRIVDGPIDDAWYADLRSLSEKIEFTYGHQGGGGAGRGPVSSAPASGGGSGGTGPEAAAAAAAAASSLSDLSVSPYQTPAGKDSLPVVEKLRAKATSRLRDHLLRSMGELVKPKTSMQKQQEYVLMKAAVGMAFLSDHAPEVAREVRTVYADTVGRSIAEIFKRYSDDLTKAVLPPPTLKGETITDLRPPTPGVPAAHPPSGNGEAFSLSAGGRMAVLQHAADPPLAAHVVAAERTRLPYEAVFRSLQRHLVDVGHAEDSFDRRFFGEKHGGDVFATVLGRTVTVLIAGLEEHLAAASSDAPGMMLLVALVAAQRRLLAERGSKCLDAYFDRVVLLLWPRFKACLDANLAAIRSATKEPPPLSRRLGPIDVGVHPVTRRYAEFISSLLVLHRTLAEQQCSDDMLPHHINAMTREMDGLLNRMAGEAAPSRTGRVVFLINNYSTLYNTAVERGVHLDDALTFETALKAQVEQYVDAEMETHFRALGAFVRKTEEAAISAAAAQGVPIERSVGPDGQALPPRLPEGITLMVPPAEAEAIIRDLGMSWRAGIKALADNVTRYFPDPRHSVAVMKRVMGAFVALYERFGIVLARAFPPSAPFLKEMVPVATIFFEIRRNSGLGGA